MTSDPELAVLAASTMAVGYTMVFSGLKKHAIELKRRKRRCPSCGRQIVGSVCRQH
jgi:hypothetical protein